MSAHPLKELSADMLLFTHAPTRGQARLVAMVAIAVTVVFAATLPFRYVVLPRSDSFIPVVDTVLVLGDLLTAVLLFTQAAAVRSRAFIALGGGYLFASLIIIPHCLTFPGAFSPSGLLGGGASTTIWLNIFWHSGLPAAAIVYAMQRRIDDVAPLPVQVVRTRIFQCIAVCAVLAAVLTLLATRGYFLLPELMSSSTTWIPSRVNIAAMLPVTLSVLAIAVLWPQRRSLLDLWLMLVMWGWLLETVLAMVSNERFSVVWYAGRIAALCSGLLVLVMLLVEITRLYGRLAHMVTSRNREREQRSLTMNAVAAAMAHEIKQPLASIVANAGAGTASVERGALDKELIGELFEAIERDGMNAGGVVDSIRAMFAAQPIHRTRLDVNELIQEAVALIRREADASDVALAVPPVSGSLAANGDHLQLKHVLLNLLVNSIEAMKPVTDRTRLLRIDAAMREDLVMVTISDNGIGFADTRTDRVFEPFFTTKPQGTGMGLPLCRSIVELHGGRIWAEHGKPYGAVLRFSLPAAD